MVLEQTDHRKNYQLNVIGNEKLLFRCDVKFPLNFCVMMKRDKTVNGELSFKFLREEICENDVLSKIESGPWASYLHTCADTNASPELTTSGMNS